ncbi:ATP-binding protein [Vibrio hangzhouensis]|uniref:histidine kinase n=1 Tax=Vibrio hangzhouensis TaxID=462991 RepID=A0A1H6C4D6_9VIBR|nr:ATP-binding protein [Vibrio hangzhouensis]SEG67860.1 Signal transduction histidine kinase [Vibrio hangzhouensis]
MTSSQAIERKLKREIAARKEAERLLEAKSLELYYANQKLEVALIQVEKRSQASFKKLHFQQKIERILIYFGKTLLRSNLDDVLLNGLVKHIEDISSNVSCSIELQDQLLPTLSTASITTSRHFECEDVATITIPIQVEQNRVGKLMATVANNEYNNSFVRSQLSLICELLTGSISRQLINLRLVESKERAEASERSTREFLAMINHELRTPLNGLLGSAELLADTGLTEIQKDLHRNLNHSGQLLKAIINDLLDFSKIEAGMLELIETTFDWNTLESTLRSIFEHQAAEKRLSFSINADSLSGRLIQGDLERLTQIFVNLIGNAIKFTDQGRVELNAIVRDSDVEFLVSDTGIGISSEAQRSLFQPFIQVDRSSTRNYEGTGLGLAICKRLVELMDGQIALDSRLGEGTTFRVILPLMFIQHNADVIQQANPKEPASDLSALNVLVVDDIKMNQIVITKMLSKLGIKADLAVNGAQALEWAAKRQYDIIFMDCRMPVMDGFEATRRLRESNYTNPIIALTAGTTLEERQTCYAVGMDDILSKPYTAQELTLTLTKWASSESLQVR